MPTLTREISMNARLLVLLAALSASGAAAQQNRGSLRPVYTKVFEVEGMDAAGPITSPDGKWIVFNSARENSQWRHLWIVEASGGQPRQLTTGNYHDGAQHWFPGSDRLVFSSSRVGGALMTIGFNTSTGRVTGDPQRLTLDAPVSGLAVSPDGKWVVYSTNTLAPVNPNPGVLRIVPATGGAARMLDSSAAPGAGFLGATFTGDGQYVEYMAVFVNAPEEIRRVAVTGGRPTVLMKGSSQTHFNGRPGLLQFHAGDGIVMNVRPGNDTVGLQTFGGEPLGQFTLRGIRPQSSRWKLEPQGTSLLVSANVATHEVKLLSTDGGAPRTVRGASADNYIGGFATGDRLVIWGPMQGARETREIVSFAGQTETRYALPDSANGAMVTNDGKLHYWYRGGGGTGEFGVYDVTAGTSRTISRSWYSCCGTDYTSRLSSRDEVLYAEHRSNQRELRAWSPVTSTSRLLRTFPAGTNVYDYAQHGDVVAYSIRYADSVAVYVAGHQGTAPQRVVGVRGRHLDGLSISRDGRRLAFGIEVINGRDTTHAVGFAELQPNGTLASPARLVPAGYVDGITWLADNNEVLYLTVNGGTKPSLVRLSAQPGARPRVITDHETLSFWDYVVSPDGKWVAYLADLPMKSTIWRVDLPGLRGR
jgi:Tol biopolymer transport system component